MKCTKCGTDVPQNSAACKRCGTPAGGKAPAAAALPDEYDLMPLEPEKPAAEPQPPAADPSAPPQTAQMARMKGVPTGSGGPPPLDPNYRGANVSPPESKLGLYAGAGVAILFILFIGWRMFRTKNELVVGRAKHDTTLFLQPGQTNVSNFEVTGTIPYTMDVTVSEGDVQVAIIQRPHKSPTTLIEIKKLPDPFETLRKGDSKTFSGEFKHKEQWSWVIYNDTKKVARVKLKFSAG